MNKIGLVITKCMGGFSMLYTANGGEWTRRVGDIRQDLVSLFNFTNDNNYVTLMTYTQAGTYIIVARPIGGRGGDYLAGWIFIPENLDVNGANVAQLIAIVKQQLGAPRLDTAALDHAFAVNYPTLESAALQPSTTENVFAVRQPGFYPIDAILGDGRYQAYYADYKYVILRDNDTPNIIANVADLSRQPLATSMVIRPPYVQNMPGVTVHLNDIARTPFDRPMRCQQGQTINIVLKRKGFNFIQHQEVVNNKDQVCSLPNNMQWTKTITKAMFNVVDRDTDKDLNHSAQIYINNKLLNNNGVTLSENEVRNATVKVTANGYNDRMQSGVDLLARELFNIRLEHGEQANTYNITLSNGAPATITINGKNLPHRMNSPLEGYELQGNRLVAAGNTNKIVYMLLGFGGACLLALVIWLIVLAVGALFGDKETDPENNTDTIEQYEEDNNNTDGKETQQEDPLSLDKAVEYLDTHDKWTKNELEAFPDLQGLFDDLNHFNRDALLGRAEKLAVSTNYNRILDAIHNNMQRQYPSICNSNPTDETITVDNYVRILNTYVPVTTQPAADKNKNNTNKNGNTNKNSNSNKNTNTNKNVNSNKNTNSTVNSNVNNSNNTTDPAAGKGSRRGKVNTTKS